MEAGRWMDRAWIIGWGILSSIWCLTASGQIGATFDEPHYLKHGLHAWRSGSYHQLLRAGTMPLPTDVEYLPVYIVEQVRDRPFDIEREYVLVQRIARAGNLAFWWLLLYFSWRLGRRFGGPWAGRLAVVFVACEPNLLAHACLATTDIAISACLAMFAEAYLAGRDKTWRGRVGLPALCFGMALLAKVSALAFAGIIIGAVELHRLWSLPFFLSPRSLGPITWMRQLWRETVAFRRETFQIFFLGFAWVFLYCGSDWRTEPGFIRMANGLPEGLWRTIMLFVAENLKIFPNAGQGIFYQIAHNFRGHGVFVMGNWFPRAVWYYFPVALTMKLTLPVMLLLAGLLITRPRSFAHPLGLIVAILFLFTFNCRVQIGIRLILPFVSFLMIGLAVAFVRAWPEHRPRWSFHAGVTALAAIMMVPMMLAWPHGLCWFNRLWGGPDEGYRYLSDSNYDWGQGLDDLTRWREEHGQPRMKMWYYGSDPRARQHETNVFFAHINLKSAEEFNQIVKGHYVAVGTTIMHSNPTPSPSGEIALSVLKTKKPIARTMTFFIYDFTEPTHMAAVP